jgi:hypothetical protein
MALINEIWKLGCGIQNSSINRHLLPEEVCKSTFKKVANLNGYEIISENFKVCRNYS